MNTHTVNLPYKVVSSPLLRHNLIPLLKLSPSALIMLTSCLEQQSNSSDSVDVSLELYAVPSSREDLNLHPTKDYHFVDPENNTRFQLESLNEIKWVESSMNIHNLII